MKAQKIKTITIALEMSEHEAMQLSELMRQVAVSSTGKVGLTRHPANYDLGSPDSADTIDMKVFNALDTGHE